MQRVKLTPLTEEESKFAAEHYYVVDWYFRIKKYDKEEYYDVAVMGYLQAVKKWFARPELHRWSFTTIAKYSMWTRIGNEQRQHKNKISTISLDSVIQGTDNLTYMDTITYSNLEY